MLYTLHKGELHVSHNGTWIELDKDVTRVKKVYDTLLYIKENNTCQELKIWSESTSKVISSSAKIIWKGITDNNAFFIYYESETDDIVALVLYDIINDQKIIICGQGRLLSVYNTNNGLKVLYSIQNKDDFLLKDVYCYCVNLNERVNIINAVSKITTYMCNEDTIRFFCIKAYDNYCDIGYLYYIEDNQVINTYKNVYLYSNKVYEIKDNPQDENDYLLKYKYVPDLNDEEYYLPQNLVDKIVNRYNEELIEDVFSLKKDQDNPYMSSNICTFHFVATENKSYYLTKELSKFAFKVEKLPNIMLDDITENYCAYFYKDQVENILLMHSACGGCWGYNICGINIINLMFKWCNHYGNTLNNEHNTMNMYHSDKHMQIVYKINSPGLPNSYDDYYVEYHPENIITDLMKACSITTENQLFNYMFDNYIKELLIERQHIYDYVNMHNSNNNINCKQELNRIYSDLVNNNSIPAKWKSEVEMFKLIKKYFPDALMHYNDKWLERQHLDVFVPSIKVAFEYQGLQHYFPVEYFGGKKSLENMMRLDNLKKNKCSQNNVKVILWDYNEIINEKTLKRKLNEIGIHLK